MQDDANTTLMHLFQNNLIRLEQVCTCIRDDDGAFVLVKTEQFSPICEVHIGEALDLLSALDWVHGLNLGPIDFELDVKRVVGNFFYHLGTSYRIWNYYPKL